MNKVDKEFYNRADAHIFLANDQIGNKNVKAGDVSASFMFGVARFNAWISATGFDNAKDFADSKQEMLEYFTKDYKKMLEQNLDEYIKNFNSHMGIEEKDITEEK